MSTKKRFLPDSERNISAIEFVRTFHKIPALTEFWTRCGKPGCRCTRGKLHGPYWLLRWREGTRQRRRYVRPDELDAVRRVLASRRAERTVEHLDHLVALRTWRLLSRQIAEVEATIAEEREP